MHVETADTMPDGWQLWRDWIKVIAPENVLEIETVEADAGEYLGYVRAVGRRRADAKLIPPFASYPTEYLQKPLLRGPE
jgi:hypothetical protein